MKAWISKLTLQKSPLTAPGRTPMPVIIALVFISLVAATVIAALVVRANQETQSQRNLADAVDVAMDSITINLDRGIGELKAIQGLFNASESVTREEFDIFVTRFIEETKGIQALEWIPRVTASQKAQFINSVRQEGFEDFTIHPETQFQEFFPVTYVVPLEGNTAALGFDLFSEDVRRAALLKAWDSGRLAITEPITLVQESGSQSAFLAYAPIYSSRDIPPTLQERRALLVGFGLGVIRFEDFINTAVPDSFDPDIDITVVDPDDPGHEILYTSLETIESIESLLGIQGLEVLRPLTIADEEWVFHFRASSGYGLSGIAKIAWILILILGLLFSVIILSIVLLLFRGRQAAITLSVERQQSEEVQRALAQELSQLIDTANNPILGIDKEGLVDIWNEAMQKITGVSRQDAMGQPALHFIAIESRESAQKTMQSVLSGISCENVAIDFLNPMGESTTLLINGSARRNPEGDIVGAIAVCLDISERLRTEKEIRALNLSLETRVKERTKELQEAADELESFSYSVSHDLRGPLRSINGFSLAVLEQYGDRLDDRGRSYLERSRSATLRMGRLIDDLLALSRLGRAEFIPMPLNLSKMAQARAVELKAEDSKREVDFIISDDLTAFGDEQLMSILVDNLIRNAWKFSSKHSTARIEVGKQEQNGETVYFVKDDGAGFDMEYADKLFLPFQRLHSSEEFEGTGIGLATVKRIIQRHGGRVWAEGEVEKGAIFYFTLGVRLDHPHE